MHGRGQALSGSRWSRAQLLRAAVAGGAVVAGGTTMGLRGVGGGTSQAAPSSATDTEVLNLFLLLEYVQDGFYGEAVNGQRLDGELLQFAQTVGKQEREHAAFLADRLGRRARARPRLDFGDALGTPERFRTTAIELEETSIAAYVGQGGNLTRDAVAAVAPLVSVEARQAAWVRSLAGVSPAPRAADPARKADDILSDLRKQGFIK